MDNETQTPPTRRHKEDLGGYILVDEAEIARLEKRRKNLGKFLVMLMIALLAGLMGWQLFVALYWLGHKLLAASLAGGLLAGLLASQLFRRPPLQPSIENTPGQLTAVLAILMLGASAAGIVVA